MNNNFLQTAVLLPLLFAGCTQHPMMADPFAHDQTSAMATSPGGRGTARRADSQNAYRRELLKNQLQQSQLDLQSASTPEEYRSVQERIEIIQGQLRRSSGPR